MNERTRVRISSCSGASVKSIAMSVHLPGPVEAYHVPVDVDLIGGGATGEARHGAHVATDETDETRRDLDGRSERHRHRSCQTIPAAGRSSAKPYAWDGQLALWRGRIDAARRSRYVASARSVTNVQDRRSLHLHRDVRERGGCPSRLRRREGL